LLAIIAAPLMLLFVVAASAVSKPEPTKGQVSPAISSSLNVPQPQQAGNSREQIIAERLKLSLVDGEIQWIELETERFLAICRDSYEALPHGGIIINISPGTVVDGRPLHRTLAKAAAAAGWFALSLQPELTLSSVAGRPSENQAQLRLDAAFDYLVTRGIQNIVVVGDAGGADDAINYIVKKASPAISGFVGLGDWNAPLEGTNVPILDIAGTSDRRALAHQQIRAEKYRRRENSIERLEIDGAGPAFYGYEDQVTKRIRGWFERVTPGVAIQQR